MLKLAKSTALKKAGAAHSLPYRHGGWKFTAPRFVADVRDGKRGAVCEASAADYWHCRQLRARSVASLALELMGWEGLDADEIVRGLTGSASGIVDQALTISTK